MVKGGSGSGVQVLTKVKTNQVPFDLMAHAILQDKGAWVLGFMKWQKGNLIHKVVRIEGKGRSSYF